MQTGGRQVKLFLSARKNVWAIVSPGQPIQPLDELTMLKKGEIK